MAEKKPSAWRKCRLCFRWCRIIALFLVLLLVIAAIYLNRVGLPEFAQSILVSKLRESGLDFECERLRWRWYQGIVADKFRLNFSPDNNPEAPQMEVGSAVLRVDPDRLRHGEVHINGVRLLNGQFTLPLVETNRPVFNLKVSDIQTDLVFHPDGVWELRDFTGHSQGLNFDVKATLTNASMLKTMFRKQENRPRKSTGIWQRQVRQVSETLDRLDFSEPPTLEVRLAGDAADTNSLTATLSLKAPTLRTPWGSGEDFVFRLPVQAEAGETGLFEAPFEFSAQHVHTPWGHVDRISSSGLATQSLTNSMPESLKAEIELKGFSSEHAQTDKVLLSVSGVLPSGRGAPISPQVKLTAKDITGPAFGWVRSLDFEGRASLSTNQPLPRASGTLLLGGIQTSWGEVDSLRLSGDFAPATPEQQALADDSWAWWGKLAPYAFTWDLAATNLLSNGLDLRLDTLESSGSWSAPKLRVERLAAHLYRGEVRLSTDIDVATRDTRLSALTTTDVHAFDHLLSEKSAEWLGKYQFYREPPRIEVTEATARLPEWSRLLSPDLDWHAEVLPDLTARGEIQVASGAFKEVRYQSASSHAVFTNGIIHLPDLEIRRDEGTTQLDFTSSSLTQEYHFGLDGHINLKDARPVLEGDDERKVLDEFTFTLPPRIRGDVWGRWHHPEETGLDLKVTMTNFSYRGLELKDFDGRGTYSNKVARVFNPIAHQGDGEVTADGVLIDWQSDEPAARRIFFTNAVSTIDPYKFVKVIGPQTSRAIAPYQFAKPPLVHLSGSVPFQDTDTTDMHFNIVGGPFHWWKFNLPELQGDLAWVTNRLVLTNMSATFYEGGIKGGAAFQFVEGGDADFQLGLNFTNANFTQVMRDLFDTTNEMSGTISGRLRVDSAKTQDMGSWNGEGYAYLTNGYLWSIPMFGFMSGMLNEMAPGLGKATVDQGTASFKMTNSVMHTQDMEFRSTAMRLQYRGTITYEGLVNATVEAQLFRDQGLLGKVVRYLTTPVTKLFVYRVTGHVNKPEMEPEFIPKFLMNILNPVSLFRGIFQGGEAREEKAAEREEKRLKEEELKSKASEGTTGATGAAPKEGAPAKEPKAPKGGKDVPVTPLP